MAVFYGILIPFLGTSLGAACVFFMKKSLGPAVQCALSGFAAGVMVAASMGSLLVPSIRQAAAMGRLAFVPAVVGFWVGILLLGQRVGLRPELLVALADGGDEVVFLHVSGGERAVEIVDQGDGQRFFHNCDCG